MARQKRVRKGGAGYGGLIALIVICIVLLAGYYFLGMEYYGVRASLNELHESVKTNLETPLGSVLGVAGSQRAKASDLAYDADFFRKVADAAAKGNKYDDLAVLAGFEGEDTNTLVSDYLKAVGPAEVSLRSYMNKQEQRISQLSADNKSLSEELRNAQSDKESALDMQRQAEKQMNAALADKNKVVDDLKSKQEAALSGFRKNVEEADKTAKAARSDLETALSKHRKESTALSEQIEEQNRMIAELKEELARKKPVELAVKEGAVLEVDPINGSAIINMGQLEGIQMGESFTVMKIGKGAERIPKGTLKVISVKNAVSVCDVMSLTDENEFITRQDIVRRDKRTAD